MDKLRWDVEQIFSAPLGSEEQLKSLRSVFDRTFNIPVAAALDALILVAFPDISSRDASALFSLGRRAELSMADNEFHSPQHAFLVALVSALLAKNIPRFRECPRLCLLSAMAGLGHDHDHPGKAASQFSDLEIEARSGDITSTIMSKCGLPSHECEFVFHIILSSFPGLRVPLMRLVDDLELGAGQRTQGVVYPRQLPQSFQNEPNMVYGGAVLSDADLFYSIAVDIETTLELTRRLLVENGFDGDRAHVDRAAATFIEKVSGRNFATAPGAKFLRSLFAIEEGVRSRAGGSSLKPSDDLKSYTSQGYRILSEASGPRMLVGRSGMIFPLQRTH